MDRPESPDISSFESTLDYEPSQQTDGLYSIPSESLAPSEPLAPRGTYTKAEKAHFIEVLGPGAPVALESLRKLTKIRVKVTKHTNR